MAVCVSADWLKSKRNQLWLGSSVSIMTTIFISYRRSDAKEPFDRFYYRLKASLRNASLFLDERSIPIGDPFPAKIDQALRESRIVIAVIGEHWNIESARLRDTADWVRIDIPIPLAQVVL